MEYNDGQVVDGCIENVISLYQNIGHYVQTRGYFLMHQLKMGAKVLWYRAAEPGSSYTAVDTNLISECEIQVFLDWAAYNEHRQEVFPLSFDFCASEGLVGIPNYLSYNKHLLMTSSRSIRPEDISEQRHAAQAAVEKKVCIAVEGKKRPGRPGLGTKESLGRFDQEWLKQRRVVGPGTEQDNSLLYIKQHMKVWIGNYRHTYGVAFCNSKGGVPSDTWITNQCDKLEKEHYRVAS